MIASCCGSSVGSSGGVRLCLIENLQPSAGIGVEIDASRRICTAYYPLERGSLRSFDFVSVPFRCWCSRDVLKCVYPVLVGA